MEKEYKILEVRIGSHGKFGEVAIIKANPITTNQFGMKSHISHICDKTEDFLYLPDSPELEEAISIAQAGEIWRPDKFDFNTERVKEKATGRTLTIYCHDNLYGYDDEDENEDEDLEDEDNGCTMTFHCREYSINSGEFKQLEDTEDWEFDDEMISTPYGDLFLESFMNVNQGGLVGVQFDVSGELDLSELDDSLDYVNIKTVAVMRQPYNVWLWVYMFDDEDNNIVNFCGNDDIDGFKEYIDKLQEKFN
jgi:hypothetical protein